MVNVLQKGDNQLYANSQVIIPLRNTSCNGRMTGFMLSLSQVQNGNHYLRFEVWSPINISSEIYEMKAEYVLAKRDINNMGDYYFANVSFAENERVKIEKGSFIGIYQPPNPRFAVQTINSTEYSYYTYRGMIPRMNLSTTRALNECTMVNDSQPLIQLVFGK